MSTRPSEISAYFDRWFAQPLNLCLDSVADVMASIERHPFASDGTGCDYFFPSERAREHPGRFRIFSECQDVWYLFVMGGSETESDPPVYLESSLDLHIDHGIPASRIHDGSYALARRHFRDFLWQGLAHQVLARIDTPERLAAGVNGVAFGRKISLGRDFKMRGKFPGCTDCYTAPATICCPTWGAAFLDANAREEFLRRFSPEITLSWGTAMKKGARRRSRPK
jgi:hypothetical protein